MPRKPINRDADNAAKEARKAPGRKSVDPRANFVVEKVPPIMEQRLKDYEGLLQNFLELNREKPFRAWVPKFLDSLARHGKPLISCIRAGISHTTYYDYRKVCPEFVEACKMARKVWQEYAEAEMYRRAVVGTQKKKFLGNGQPLLDPETGEQYCEREYSDLLMMFMLKAVDPDKYKDRQDVTSGGKPVGQTTLSQEQLDQVKHDFHDFLVQRYGEPKVNDGSLPTPNPTFDQLGVDSSSQPGYNVDPGQPQANPTLGVRAVPEGQERNSHAAGLDVGDVPGTADDDGGPLP